MTTKASEGKKAVSGSVTLIYDDGSQEMQNFSLADGSTLVVTTSAEQKQHDLEVARKAFEAGYRLGQDDATKSALIKHGFDGGARTGSKYGVDDYAQENLE